MSRHYVHFSKEALAQLLLNGVEAFVIKHKGMRRSGIEIYATLYGREESTATTQHHYIDFISIDTSADMRPGSVTENTETRLLKNSIAQAMGIVPIGALHTHPYLNGEMSLKEVRESGCDFSPEDLALFTQELESHQWGKKSMLQVLLTIRNQRRHNIQGDGSIEDNLHEFSLGNLKCFLRAQVFALDTENCILFEPTILKSDYLSNFRNVLGDFGRVLEDESNEQSLLHRQ